MTLRSLTALFLVLTAPVASHALQVALLTPEMTCEVAGGMWDDRRDDFCESCSLCLHSNVSHRELCALALCVAPLP